MAIPSLAALCLTLFKSGARTPIPWGFFGKASSGSDSLR
jgi:hypothetical protein